MPNAADGIVIQGDCGFFQQPQRRPPQPATQRQKKWNFKDYYKLVDDHLGSGAYACVRTAIHLSTGKEYAVKVVNKHEHGHTRSRILREVQIFRMCHNHPNIVQLIEWFEDEGSFYMVFEKMRGGPLLNHIQRRTCFTEQEASLVTRDIANALKFLHDRGVAHRDVKPENILCTGLDKISPVKLCDLDLASKPFSHNENNDGVSIGSGGRTNAVHPVQSEPDLASPVGSAEFMAPEVVDTFVGEALKYDKRCDMWSLGVIIYIMLCGYPPFYGECDRANCGWDQGEPCADCQENLFQRIQMGRFDFPDDEWKNIGADAKDLIRHLLVRNVRQRYTAYDVLAHPWVTRGAPKTPLQTATNLSRNDSARDVRTVNEHFLMMNRMVPMIARISQRLEASGHNLAHFVNGTPPFVGAGSGEETTGVGGAAPMNGLNMMMNGSGQDMLFYHQRQANRETQVHV
uniref:Protein kinase domain-containing protein n=1 Tax=Globodera pallida TaxID=36090 RepID=A0A183BPP3_GLOPA